MLHPEVKQRFGGVLSVAIVPVGVTQFRDRLAALRTCDADFSKAIIDDVEVFRKKYQKSLGTNFAFLSDEFYLNAGVPVPLSAQYEGFPQLEDGVGMVRLFIDDLQKWRKKRPAKARSPRTATLVTGELAGPLVTELAEALNEVEDVDVNVCIVHNTFFEGNISVAGLLTGKDIVTALQGMGDNLGERVILPSVMLRDPDRDIFLDDMPLEKFGDILGRDVRIVERTPAAAAEAVLA